jgi:hypothetical protein
MVLESFLQGAVDTDPFDVMMDFMALLVLFRGLRFIAGK